MDEIEAYGGLEAVKFFDYNGDTKQVRVYDGRLLIDECDLDYDMTTALVERLQLWLATGSLHKGKEG